MKTNEKKYRKKWSQPLSKTGKKIVLHCQPETLAVLFYYTNPYCNFARNEVPMRKGLWTCLLIFGFAVLLSMNTAAQCSVCTRTAQQLGEKPAKGMNAGIIYLALAPFAVVGYIFYRWRKNG